MVNGSFSRWKRYTPLDLEDKAEVKEGTQIKIVEYDLAPRGIVFKSRDWQRVLDRWLQKGAQIDLFIQAFYKKDFRRIVRLMKKYPGLNVSDSSGIDICVDWEEDHPVENLVSEFKDFHFTLFYNPKQLWIERRHPIGKGYMNDCEYSGRGGFSRQSIRDPPEWEKQFERYEKWLRVMERVSKPIKVVR